MAKQMRMRGIRRKEIDEEKLALAFLMLAKILNEQDAATAADPAEQPPEDAEAA